MFESAKLKIERAKHHIIDLNGEVDIYSAQHPLRIFRSFDGKASQVTYSVKTKIPMPDLIPHIGRPITKCGWSGIARGRRKL